MGKVSYMTVNGKIRSEHRAGEAHSRDFVHDASGNVVGVYQNGWGIADAAYEPYGGIYTQWNMESGGYRFTWMGGWGYRQTLAEWSSVYVRARHYSRSIGSWLSVDPLWPSEMAYGYVEGRVMTGMDYWGMNEKKPIPGLPTNSTMKQCISFMIGTAMIEPSKACGICVRYLTYYQKQTVAAQKTICNGTRLPCKNSPPLSFTIPVKGKSVPPPASTGFDFWDIVWTAASYAAPTSTTPLGIMNDPGAWICASYQLRLRDLRQAYCEGADVESNRDKYDCPNLYPGYWGRYCELLNEVINRWSAYCSGSDQESNSCLL